MKFLKHLDKLCEWFSIPVVWFIPVLAVVVFHDVVLRDLFNAPTCWAYDVSWMLYSGFFLLGLAYTLQVGKHIRVDTLLNRFSPRLKASIEVFFYLLLFMWCIVLVRDGISYAGSAWSTFEGSGLTPWAPPVYPIKTLIPVGFGLLGLASIAAFARSLAVAIRGKSA